MRKKKDEIIKEEVTEFLKRDEIYVLGIDQGYANLGYSIIKYNILTENVDILYSNCLKTLASEDFNKRILNIYSYTSDLIENSEFQIDVMGCEKLFCNQPIKINKENEQKSAFMLRNKSASMMKTNMVTGVLYLISAEKGKELFEYPPTTVKKCIVGNGRAKKDELMDKLNTIIESSGLKIKTDHETDSVGIAITTAKEYCEYIYKNNIKNKKE